jgi:hypothetical protein
MAGGEGSASAKPPSNSSTELSASSGRTTWSIKDKNLYLLSAPRMRLDHPALKRAVRERRRLFDANVMLIEDKASGPS